MGSYLYYRIIYAAKKLPHYQKHLLYLYCVWVYILMDLI